MFPSPRVCAPQVGVDQALLLADASEAFHVFDVDGSGTIDHAEFTTLIEVLGVKLAGGEDAVTKVGLYWPAQQFYIGNIY